MVQFLVGALAVAGVATQARAAQLASATDLGGGSVQFDVVLPSGQAFVELFVRQNDIQNVALDITRHHIDHADGTSTYRFTIPHYQVGDRIEYRYYSYLPNSPGRFIPGPIEDEWRLLVYGTNTFVANDASYQLGPYTRASGGANDIEVFDTFVHSQIRPVSVGWELVRADPSPFVAPLISNAAGIEAVYVRACDGSGWVRIDGTPFAVAAPTEYVDVGAGTYTWSGAFNAELPGTRVDPRYECGGYDIVVPTLIGPQTLRTDTTTEFAYVLANKL
jgi:hypothetical protein